MNELTWKSPTENDLRITDAAEGHAEQTRSFIVANLLRGKTVYYIFKNSLVLIMNNSVHQDKFLNVQLTN